MKPGKIVLDSYALIAYFEDESSADQVKDLLQQAEEREKSLLMSIVNWGEVYYALSRSKGESKAEESILIIDQLPVTLIEINRAIAYQAARLKARYAVAFGDCFAAALAMVNQGQVLTGDPEFKNLEKDVSVIWLRG
ncbi:type II toxin-antitoxin system VapC family toxin [Candidatus Aerophobetes bacterium]|nr:type II toxin-antitoxin system VapC family toxin [Candidatus Aerophobetes bacterium]